MTLALAAILGVSNSLGYLLPAIIGLESMGIPSPGETALVAAAVLASQGKLHISLVIIIGISSAILGDNIGFLLGRNFGRDVLEAKGPLAKHRRRALEAGDRFFVKHGAKTVLIGRWIALIRVATAWLAGINEMRFLQFFFWNALGAISWGLTYGLVGYFGGKAAAHVLSQIGIAGAVFFAIVFVVSLVRWRMRERREGEATRPGGGEAAQGEDARGGEGEASASERPAPRGR